MATNGIETDRPLYESFDNGTGALGNAWNVNQSVKGEVTLGNYSGLMEWGNGASSGHGYGTYTINAKFDGTQPGAAIVLWPGDGKWPGQEIDMGEMAQDGSGRQYGIVHWNQNGSDAYEYRIYEGVQTGVFHDYQMIWEPGRITFKVDGAEKGVITNHVPTDYDAGGANNTIGFLNNNGNTSVTVRQVDYDPLGGSAPAPAPAPAPTSVQDTSAQGASSGGSANNLVLKISQDAWQGDAQYTVSVDSQQVDGVRTASASHGDGQHDTVTLQGNWNAGSHRVTVDFLNDAWGGTPATDRNLHVDGIESNGRSLDGSTADLMSAGPVDFAWFV